MYLSKDGKLNEINESNIGELYKTHFKPLVNIQGFGRVHLAIREEKLRRKRMLNREYGYPKLKERPLEKPH